MKLRLGKPDPLDDVARVRAVREARPVAGDVFLLNSPWQAHVRVKC